MSEPNTTPQRRGMAAADANEPRALRTRQSLVTALLKSVEAKGLENISVSELCREAGVHRTTFYGHWADITSFAADVFVGFIDDLARVGDELNEAGTDLERMQSTYERSLDRQLDHIREHRVLYRSLFASTHDAGFRRALALSMHRRALDAIERWRSAGVEVAADASLQAVYIAGGTVSSLAYWAASDDDDHTELSRTMFGMLPAWWPTDAAA